MKVSLPPRALRHGQWRDLRANRVVRQAENPPGSGKPRIVGRLGLEPNVSAATSQIDRFIPEARAAPFRPARRAARLLGLSCL
jgi:hypothetical protein